MLSQPCHFTPPRAISFETCCTQEVHLPRPNQGVLFATNGRVVVGVHTTLPPILLWYHHYGGTSCLWVATAFLPDMIWYQTYRIPRPNDMVGPDVTFEECPCNFMLDADVRQRASLQFCPNSDTTNTKYPIGVGYRSCYFH